MKIDWKKNDKELYLPKTTPCVIDAPRHKFYTISGSGNPNDDLFGEAIGALYALSYGIKMMPKKGVTPEGYFEFTIYPLEGVWDLSEAARGSESFSKDELVYKIMIRQPDFVTQELARENLENVKKSKPDLPLENAAFEEEGDGFSVQMLHVGSYDGEHISFEKMEAFCAKNGLERTEKYHREIYLSDPRKTAVEKLKTVLRFQVKRI